MTPLAVHTVTWHVYCQHTLSPGSESTDSCCDTIRAGMAFSVLTGLLFLLDREPVEEAWLILSVSTTMASKRPFSLLVPQPSWMLGVSSSLELSSLDADPDCTLFLEWSEKEPLLIEGAPLEPGGARLPCVTKLAKLATCLITSMLLVGTALESWGWIMVNQGHRISVTVHLLLQNITRLVRL